MLPLYVFWLRRENVILLVCDIYALPAINPGVKPVQIDSVGCTTYTPTLLNTSKFKKGLKACAIF